MDEQIRLLALAHLQNGNKPAEVAELVGISYATALKLKKELTTADERNTILELFKLDKAALEILLESVKRQLTPAIDAFGIGELVDDEVKHLTKSIEGGKLLSQQFQASASTLANKITSAAVTATNAETILALTKALCELQRAFFSPEGSGTGGNHLPISSFEQHLQK